ncbi:hypothetical protein L218DRAFT_1022447 [Marasmius fiardii PR-910]|nr:hypothetical protein L218DRAFT_1022447 [Marasmius fiardii PR-910]
MAPNKNKRAPAAESPPPVQDPPSASTNISSVPLPHICTSSWRPFAKDLEPAASVVSSSKGKGKAKAVTAPSKVVKKKTNATASISEEQPTDLGVIYVPGTEAAPVTFEQLATLSTVVYKIGLQGPEGLGMLLSQHTQLFEACHRLSGIRVLLDTEVNWIHTQIDELTTTIKHATRDPRYVAHMLNSDDLNHLPLSGDEVAILPSALEWPTSMFSPEDTEVVIVSANKVQVKDKAQGTVITTAPFISGKGETDVEDTH